MFVLPLNLISRTIYLDLENKTCPPTLQCAIWQRPLAPHPQIPELCFCSLVPCLQVGLGSNNAKLGTEMILNEVVKQRMWWGMSCRGTGLDLAKIFCFSIKPLGKQRNLKKYNQGIGV